MLLVQTRATGRRAPLGVLVLALSTSGGSACGTPPEVAGGAPAAPPPQVVARVGDEVIDVEAVRRYVSAHGGSAREALRVLEDDALLRQAAERAGWHGARADELGRDRERLLAQRVLLDLERQHPLDGPTDDEVAAYLRANAPSIVRESQRDCVQVIVQLPQGASPEQEQAARDYATQTLARMRIEGVESVWAAQPPEHQGLRVLSQHLPPATASTPMPEAFRRVVFELDAPGPASEPVRTADGWHAVAVTDIHPAVLPDSPSAQRIARERLVTEQRRAALDALIQTLVDRFPVEVSAPHVQVVLPLLQGAERPGS